MGILEFTVIFLTVVILGLLREINKLMFRVSNLEIIGIQLLIKTGLAKKTTKEEYEKLIDKE